jgi:CheY-like chemotaxis protein
MSATAGRVLVVDDSDVIRELITVYLELEGFEVATAVDGEDCLGKVALFAPDVVTLDVIMPRLDGFRTAARLRQDPRTAALPIVMLTACAQEDDFRRGEELGVDAYLTKPFEPSSLIRTVRELAGRCTTATPNPLAAASRSSPPTPGNTSPPTPTSAPNGPPPTYRLPR